MTYVRGSGSDKRRRKKKCKRADRNEEGRGGDSERLDPWPWWTATATAREEYWVTEFSGGRSNWQSCRRLRDCVALDERLRIVVCMKLYA